MRLPAAAVTTTVASLMAACGLSVLGVSTGSESAIDASTRETLPEDAGGTLDDANGSANVAPLADASCPEAGACDRILFVTNDRFTGDLGGLTGADEICRKAANSSPLAALKSRQFMAWVAADGATPITRFDKRGRFVRADGLALAESWGDLVDGTIARFVEVSEDGGIVTINDDDVWTAVKPNGTAGPTSCRDWTTADAGSLGWIGLVARIDAQWTEARTDPCNDTNHLYCIER